MWRIDVSSIYEQSIEDCDMFIHVTSSCIHVSFISVDQGVLDKTNLPGWFGQAINTGKWKILQPYIFSVHRPTTPLHRSSKCFNNFVVDTKVTCKKIDITSTLHLKNEYFCQILLQVRRNWRSCMKLVTYR